MNTPSSDEEEKLVDFSSDVEKIEKTECEPEIILRKQEPTQEFGSNSNDNTPENHTSRKNYSRLCGYLNKLGNRPLLKTYRRRWFVFSESNCKLYYYRSHQDQIPLGEIDISKATFSFDVSNKEKTGLFTISVPGRDYFLEAVNRQTCLFWLQELQKFRQSNSLLRTNAMSDKATSSTTLRERPQSGLLASMWPELSNDSNEDVPLMLPIECPNDAIGDDSAFTSSKPLSSAQQKFNELRNQVKTTAGFMKYDKSPSESCLDSSFNEFNTSHKKSLSTTSEKEPSVLENILLSSAKSIKAPGLSALRSKFSSSFRKVRSDEDSRSVGDKHAAGKDGCFQCYKLNIKLENMTDEVSTLEDEVAASRDIFKVLQRQLDISSKEKETLTQIYQLKDKDEQLKLCSEKDQEIVNLKHDIQEQKQQVETLQRLVGSLKSEMSEMQGKNNLYEELIHQKDKTIMSLTNEVFDLETERQDQKHRNDSNTSFSENVRAVEVKEEETFEDLKDAVQAFELQNKFLNKELLELNQLRRDSEERVKLMSIKCSEWEARSYQIQSKLLFLLNELSKPGEITQDVISQLLEEAMGDSTDHTKLLSSWSSERMYDELGFNWRWGKTNLLSSKATNLMQKSEDITSKAKDPELVSWRVKWDNFMVALGSKELQRSPELKLLVRQGVPHESKGKIWKGCVHMRVKNYRIYLGPDYYNSLLTSDRFVSRIDPSSKQIELDLLRTLPNNCHYEHIDSDGIPKLRRVLLAYSRHDPSVGYCQGLNRLAAISLLFMEEEDAFWCLVAITKFIMPDGYYSRTLIGSQVDQRVLKELMADKLPRIHVHLEQNNVDLSLFTFNWFLTVFVDNIPVQTYLRIWDAFLYEGSKVLFRFALAFFKMCENEILQQMDYMAINKYLRTISENSIDVKKLTQIAFNELNPFPQRMINHKRAQHLLTVQAQLDELESIRQSLPRSEKISSTPLSDED